MKGKANLFAIQTPPLALLSQGLKLDNKKQSEDEGLLVILGLLIDGLVRVSHAPLPGFFH